MAVLLIILLATIGLALRAGLHGRRWNIAESDTQEGSGDDWMIDVVVCPNGRNRSITSSRCWTSRTWSFMKKQSSPVMRWHSTTSALSRASPATFASWRGAGRTRSTTLSAYPSARGSTSVR